MKRWNRKKLYGKRVFKKGVQIFIYKISPSDYASEESSFTIKEKRLFLDMPITVFLFIAFSRCPIARTHTHTHTDVLAASRRRNSALVGRIPLSLSASLYFFLGLALFLQFFFIPPRTC